MWHQIGFPLSPHNQNDEFRVFDISDIDASISWVIHEANRDEAGDTLPRSSDTREHVGYSEFIVNPIHRPQATTPAQMSKDSPPAARTGQGGISVQSQLEMLRRVIA